MIVKKIKIEKVSMRTCLIFLRVETKGKLYYITPQYNDIQQTRSSTIFDCISLRRDQ